MISTLDHFSWGLPVENVNSVVDAGGYLEDPPTQVSRCNKSGAPREDEMASAAVASSTQGTDYGVNAAERLIVALDVETVAEAQAIVEELGPTVSFFKVGPALQWDERYREFLGDLLRDHCQVFLDHKYSDIGSTMQRNVAGAAVFGVDFLTIQGTTDLSEADLRYAVAGREQSRDRKLKVFLVTVLTSLDQQDLDSLGIQESLTERVVRRAEMAERVGLDGVIASGLEAHAIRDAIPNSNFLIVTPGIRPKGSTKHEQKRTCTPYEAVGNGADYLVVGRPIIQSDQKMDTVLEITKGMQKAFDERAAHRQKRRPSRGGASDYR